jgi:hypoxanthine phosphoribosyltransferase
MVLAFQTLCFLLSVIGSVASVWFIVEKIFRWKRLSWRCAEKSAETVAGHLTSDGYLPSLIVGIGRGGAIFGAMISGCLGHRPLLVIDRKYRWKEGRRLDDMILHLDIPEEMLSAVLLVAGETHTGNTMKLFCDYFSRLGAQNVRRATFFLQEGSTERIEYTGVQSAIDRRMPWMSSQHYRRDSRSQQEVHSLSTIKTTKNDNSQEAFDKSTPELGGAALCPVTECQDKQDS